MTEEPRSIVAANATTSKPPPTSVIVPHLESFSLTARQIRGNISCNWNHEALALIRLDHADDPKGKTQQPDQNQQHGADAEGAEMSEAIAAVPPAQAKHHGENASDDVQSGKRHDRLGSM